MSELTSSELEDLPPPETELERAERARAKRKAATREARDAQRVKDLAALEEIEIALGDSNVAVIEVPHTPGLPTLCACRTPTDAELKRYRHRVAAGAQKQEEGKATDPLAGVKAAEELADLVRVYPPDDAYAEMRKARSGVHAQLGTAAVRLALGRKEDEGKA